jgi:hypothetical protein
VGLSVAQNVSSSHREERVRKKNSRIFAHERSPLTYGFNNNNECKVKRRPKQMNTPKKDFTQDGLIKKEVRALSMPVCSDPQGTVPEMEGMVKLYPGSAPRVEMHLSLGDIAMDEPSVDAFGPAIPQSIQRNPL